MKVLLDENLPHRLRSRLPGHDVFTVAYMGWASVKNGALLALAAEAGFDVLITKDMGIAYEQNQATIPCALLVVQARTNSMKDIEPRIGQILEALGTLQPRTIVRVR